MRSGQEQAGAGQSPRGCDGHLQRCLPKRIILVRHGESQGNLDTSAYTTTPDYRIPLTPLGAHQARQTGRRIRDVLVSSGALNWKVYFYVSPYERTRSTLRELGRAFPRHRILGVREECRVREQDFGNFQVEERMRAIKETRVRFGRFFFRFPEGESAADVLDRVASFMESMWRDIDMRRLNQEEGCETNLVIVSHGLTSRVFLMKWFKWTVEQFEQLNNPENCEFRVMQLGPGGTEYSLAVHHSPEELERWGLSQEMIADQQWRATAHRGSRLDECPWYLDSFFGHRHDGDDEDVKDSNTSSKNCSLDREQEFGRHRFDCDLLPSVLCRMALENSICFPLLIDRIDQSIANSHCFLRCNLPEFGRHRFVCELKVVFAIFPSGMHANCSGYFVRE